ncbi:MAG TPA: PAS domain S-box protein [Burkholderiaceae bacterium]|jgi:PAS domain S-box-containing protein|nr:PAS domain S-box protein [Burkholderiaceae bacterium]
MSAFLLGLAFGVLGTAGAGLLWLLRREERAQQVAVASGEAFAAAISKAAPDAMFACRADGCVAWANEASASTFGRTPEELRGSPLTGLLPMFSSLTIADWMRSHGIRGRVVGMGTDGLRVDGTPFPCAVSASQCEVTGHDYAIFMVRDTSDSRWAEQELLLRERALESASDGITIASMEFPGQPVIYANPAFRRISGYDLDEVIGRNCRFLQGEDTSQVDLGEVRSAIREGRSTRVVLRNRRKDGSPFWNELRLSPVRRDDGRVTHYVGVQTDITERMAYEDMLQQRTERLNTIFDLSPDGFVAMDERDCITVVNSAFERMTGLAGAELIGQPRSHLDDCLAAISRGQEPLDAVGVADTLPAQEPQTLSQRPYVGELIHLAAPGQRTLLRRVRHSRGAGHETVMYFRDITRELEVDRMKSEFLSMAAHELRTPMASIFGFTELLLRRSFDEPRRQDMLGTIHRQAGILINLVNELLDLARIEARRGADFHRRVQPLAPIIETTVAGILVHNDPRKVQARLPPQPVMVLVDESKLALALTNVLSNAYKYSAKDRDIHLELRQRERGGRAEVGVAVIDQGMGMTAEQRARLFERFFRADTSGNIPGTGLGMTIVKEIVELLDGQVAVDSEFGQGTTVTLWFPVATQPASPLPGEGRTDDAAVQLLTLT